MRSRPLALAAVMAAFVSSALAQAPGFPQNMPPNTVYGRSGISTGPGQAIPFSVIVQTLNNQVNIWTQPQTFSGGTTSPLTDGVTAIAANNNSNKTALQIYCPFSVNGCNPTTGGTEYDVGRFVLDLESVTGGTVSQANAIAAYANCNVVVGPYPAAGNCVAVSGFSVIAKNGGQAWGIATSCQDNTSAATYVGTALSPRICNGAEFDVGVWDSAGTARAGGVLVSLQGGGTSALELVGYNLINASFGGLKWTFGYNCDNGAVSISCISAGAVAASGTSIASQAIAWQYFNGSAVNKAMTMASPGSGGFIFTTTDTSIGTALDWSSVSITACTLRIVAGCIINGSGAIEAFGTLGVNAFAANTTFTSQGPDATTGTFAGKFQNSAAAVIASFRDDGLVFLFGPVTGTIYSAAGTPLPTCNSGIDGASAVVSDATGATYAGTYSSGGAQKRRVLCVNGTGWITN